MELAETLEKRNKLHVGLPVLLAELEVFSRLGPNRSLARCQANARLLLSNDGNTGTCHPLESSVQHRQVRDFGF
jgi:hypothetical protein